MTRQENRISANEEPSLAGLRVESTASPLHMLPNLISAPLFFTVLWLGELTYSVCHVHRPLHVNQELGLIPRGNRGAGVVHCHLQLMVWCFLKIEENLVNTGGCLPGCSSLISESLCSSARLTLLWRHICSKLLLLLIHLWRYFPACARGKPWRRKPD